MTDQHTTNQRTEQPYDEKEDRGIIHGLKHRLPSLPWLARAAAVCLSSVSIGFVVLFMFILESAGDITLITRPVPMQIALTLPYLVGVLTLGTTLGALLAWRYRYWSLSARIHQTILAILGLLFSWQLSTLGFLGF